MNHEHESSISERVQTSIDKGVLRMLPHSHFVLQFVALVCIASIVFLLSAVVASYILFSIEEGGEALLLGFGVRGVTTFLVLFPWIPFVIDVAAILVLRLLLRNTKMIYRIPFPLAIGALLVTSMLAAFIINLTPLHSDLKQQADMEDSSILDALYDNIGMPDEERGEFRGIIIDINGRVMSIRHDDGDSDDDDDVRVIAFPEAIDISSFQMGDEIYVAGSDEDDDEVFEAYGVHKIHNRREREEHENE